MTQKPKNPVELEKMRRAGKLAASVLDFVTPHVKAGVSTLALNDLCHEFIIKNNGIPAPLNYRGFPKSICTSINEVVCHGIPAADQILKDGDIMNIDVTVILDGFHGDTSRMYTVGEISPEAKKLIQCTYEAMMNGIGAVKSGARINEIGVAIEARAERDGFSVVREYCGHGIGTIFHDEPMILHFSSDEPTQTGRMRKGWTFTVEPMINVGDWPTRVMDDNWTVKTRDNSLSAQFEHTIAVTDEGFEIFTLSPAGFTLPPYKC